jgi:hypothetical protein
MKETTPDWWLIENPRGRLRELESFDEAVRLMGGVRHSATLARVSPYRKGF